MWRESCFQLAAEIDRDAIVEGIVVFVSSEVTAHLTSMVYKSIEHVTSQG